MKLVVEVKKIKRRLFMKLIEKNKELRKLWQDNIFSFHILDKQKIWIPLMKWLGIDFSFECRWKD